MNEMLLVVMLAGRRAALPAIEVNSVIELAEVTPVPRAAAHVTGLAALRSRPLTVIDCTAALGIATAAADWRRQRAVVVEHEGHLYGLLVDGAPGSDVDGEVRKAIHLRSTPGSAGGADSIYRYDRAGLMAALLRAGEELAA